MYFYWVMDRVGEKPFRVCWRPGKTNTSEYFTKHCPPKNNFKIIPVLLITIIQETKEHILQGFVDMSFQNKDKKSLIGSESHLVQNDPTRRIRFG